MHSTYLSGLNDTHNMSECKHNFYKKAPQGTSNQLNMKAFIQYVWIYIRIYVTGFQTFIEPLFFLGMNLTCSCLIRTQ